MHDAHIFELPYANTTLPFFVSILGIRKTELTERHTQLYE